MPNSHGYTLLTPVLAPHFPPPTAPRLLRWAQRHGASVSGAWRVLQPTVAGDGDRTCCATERLEEGIENDGDFWEMFRGIS